MHILVINVHSTANAGDRVLLEVTLEQMRRLFPGCTVTVAMNDPAPVEGAQVVGSFVTWLRRPASQGGWRAGALLLAPVTALRVRRALHAIRSGRLGGQQFAAPRRDLLDSYRDADLVVSCPGNFIYSSGRVGLPLMLALGAIEAALQAGKPTYMLPQTVGPLRRRWEFAWMNRLVERVRLVLVRDAASLALLRLGGACCSHVAVAPDVALLFPGAGPEAGNALLAQAGVDVTRPGPRLGMTLVNWGAQNPRFGGQSAYEAAMAAAARAFVEQQQGTVVLFPQVTGPSRAEDDRIPARRVRDRLADLGARVALVDAPVEPGVLKSAYGQMDLFLGTRLHSNLFALTAGTPVVAIAYQPKTRGVMELAGLGEWVIEIEQARGDAPARLLRTAWAQRETLRAHLRAVLPGLEREAASAFDAIRSDYESVAEARAGV